MCRITKTTISGMVPNNPMQKDNQKKEKKTLTAYFIRILHRPRQKSYMTESCRNFQSCIRGALFCQAGIIYRPVRSATAKAGVSCKRRHQAPLGEFSPPPFLFRLFHAGLCENLIAITEPQYQHCNASLRIDNFTLDLMDKNPAGAKKHFTCPEAGTSV